MCSPMLLSYGEVTFLPSDRECKYRFACVQLDLKRVQRNLLERSTK